MNTKKVSGVGLLGAVIVLLSLAAAPVAQSAVNAPTLTATVQNQACQSGDFVNVTLTATLSPPVRNVRYQWDFNNDGVFDTPLSANPTVSHLYPDESTQTATVRVVKGTRSATDSVTFATIRCGG